MTERIGVALSGGADSAVTASLLLSRGHRIFGLHMLLADSPAARAQAAAAAALAGHLGIECSVIDMVDPFARHVIAPFCRDYASGRTPNPCVVCNREIKFGMLLAAALDRGADRLATGHYARISERDGARVLQRAADAQADQSYFLYAIDPAVLERLVLPLGDVHQAEVRADALRQGMATGRSSQDICFLEGQEVQRFLATRVPAVPGDVVDRQGRVLGRHAGLPFYTVGQRHGLGLALGQPVYVTRLDLRLNRVVVGPSADLLCSSARLEQLRWLSPPGGRTFQAQARIRYRSRAVPVQVAWGEHGARVSFLTPQRAVAPGQSVVFYDGDTVLGGGVISEAGDEGGHAD